MGYGTVGDVRQGKYFELELTCRIAPSRREALASEVADKLLANPVIESYRVEVDAVSAGAGRRRADACDDRAERDRS